MHNSEYNRLVDQTYGAADDRSLSVCVSNVIYKQYDTREVDVRQIGNGLYLATLRRTGMPLGAGTQYGAYSEEFVRTENRLQPILAELSNAIGRPQRDSHEVSLLLSSSGIIDRVAIAKHSLRLIVDASSAIRFRSDLNKISLFDLHQAATESRCLAGQSGPSLIVRLSLHSTSVDLSQIERSIRLPCRRSRCRCVSKGESTEWVMSWYNIRSDTTYSQMSDYDLMEYALVQIESEWQRSFDTRPVIQFRVQCSYAENIDHAAIMIRGTALEVIRRSVEKLEVGFLKTAAPSSPLPPPPDDPAL